MNEADSNAESNPREAERPDPSDDGWVGSGYASSCTEVVAVSAAGNISKRLGVVHNVFDGT
jgi:hypothetical protein